MGTDLLRFFIEVDEEITHTGSDVYIPKGRIYCSCGYFAFTSDGKNGMKDAVRDEIKKIEKQIIELQKKKDDIKNPFNLEGIKISREIFKLKQDLDLLNQRLSFAMVRQPDKQLLRYSPTGDVGFTKEVREPICKMVLLIGSECLLNSILIWFEASYHRHICRSMRFKSMPRRGVLL